MKLTPDTLASVHEQMALVKTQSTQDCFTNYFRQEMVGPQILTAATARTVLLTNDEHDFFRLYFFTSDLADLQQILRDMARLENAVVVRAADGIRTRPT